MQLRLVLIELMHAVDFHETKPRDTAHEVRCVVNQRAPARRVLAPGPRDETGRQAPRR